MKNIFSNYASTRSFIVLYSERRVTRMLSHSQVLVFVINFLMFCESSHQEVLIEESTTIDSLYAPTGGTVELPCDASPALPDDRMGFVIWYKQGHDIPIYSLDTREGVTSHWSDPKTLGTRASFRSTSSPAVLLVTKLRPAGRDFILK